MRARTIVLTSFLVATAACTGRADVRELARSPDHGRGRRPIGDDEAVPHEKALGRCGEQMQTCSAQAVGGGLGGDQDAAPEPLRLQQRNLLTLEE